MAVAGVDIGTTGCKCTVYSVEGEELGESYQEYENDKNSDQLLNPQLVWENVILVLKKAANKADRIDAVGISSFGESFVLIDKNDKILMNSLLYTDPRGVEECNKLIEEFGSNYINQITGLNPNPMYSLPKLMWIKENRREIYNKTEYIFLMQDFIVYRLTGSRQIDYSLASRTMAFDINQLCWNEEILKFAEIDKNRFSKPVAAGTKAGIIKKELAEEININFDAEIVTGGHDQVAAAVGAGANKSRMAVDGIGTVECITPVFKKDIDRTVLYAGSYAVVPFLNDYFATYAFSFTGGALLKWYRDQIAALKAERIKKKGGDPYTYFNQKVNLERPSPLLVLPYFSGAATPYMDNEAKGAIIGLTTESSSADIYQALMEGISFEMLLNMEKLKKAGIEIEELRATGGGAKSRQWLQMKANIYNREILALDNSEAGTLGSIMLAGVACGIFKDLETANNIFNKNIVVYKPDLSVHQKYKEKFQQYKKIYPAIKDILR